MISTANLSTMLRTASALLDGCAIALGVMLTRWMWQRRRTGHGASYMLRMCVVLIYIPTFLLLSRLFVFHFGAGPYTRLEAGRLAMVLVLLWAEVGLVRFLNDHNDQR